LRFFKQRNESDVFTGGEEARKIPISIEGGRVVDFILFVAITISVIVVDYVVFESVPILLNPLFLVAAVFLHYLWIVGCCRILIPKKK
jgi:hypothetical protein